jgi:hypothetical protein
MSIGNYLRGESVCSDTMAPSQPAVGIDHPTVVPANFRPAAETCPECGNRRSEH